MKFWTEIAAAIGIVIAARALLPRDAADLVLTGILTGTLAISARRAPRFIPLDVLYPPPPTHRGDRR